MASDMELPERPDQYRSAFILANYDALTAGQYANWLEPGNYFYRAMNHHNADGSRCSDAEAASALSAWEGFTREQRWRARIHHQSTVRVQHDTNPRLWAYYSSAFPASVISYIQGLSDSNVIRWLGTTLSAAVAAANAISNGLAGHFSSVGSRRVLGWEEDFENKK